LKKLIKVEEKKHVQRKTRIEDESILSTYTNTTVPDQTATSYSSTAGGHEDQYDAWEHSDSDEGDVGRSQDENCTCVKWYWY